MQFLKEAAGIVRQYYSYLLTGVGYTMLLALVGTVAGFCIGLLTGVGGGVMRDVLAGNTPYILVKHVYACASLAGAVLCAVLWRLVPQYVAMLAGMTAVLLIRLLSAHFRWNLPRVEDETL